VEAGEVDADAEDHGCWEEVEGGESWLDRERLWFGLNEGEEGPGDDRKVRRGNEADSLCR